MDSTLPIPDCNNAKILLKKEQFSGITTKSFFSQFPATAYSARTNRNIAWNDSLSFAIS